MRWVVALTLVLSSAMACAEGERLIIPDHPKWKEECGSCHVAYPPQLLTAGNWQRLMGELDKHFGVNAALDPKDNQEIFNFLKDNAGSAWDGMSSESGLRVSDTTWFTRKHRRVSNKIWFDPAVKSRSNCTACHVDAERGDWSERGIRIPMPGSKMPDKEGDKNTADKLDKEINRQ